MILYLCSHFVFRYCSIASNRFTRNGKIQSFCIDLFLFLQLFPMPLIFQYFWVLL
uniref:Uncharacterized protein n=1 Tax=Rhizophora mucronata TaxID=61149 RepID=A0A2P2N8C1_RHIMU